MLNTIWAVVREGKVGLLEHINLAEGQKVLVTLLPDEDTLFWLHTSQISLDTIWDNVADDVYAQLLKEGRRTMLSKTVDVCEAQSHLRELLSHVLAGVEIVLTEGDTPLARLVPVAPRMAGLHPGAIWTSDDFDAPLPEELWTGSV